MRSALNNIELRDFKLEISEPDLVHMIVPKPESISYLRQNEALSSFIIFKEKARSKKIKIKMKITDVFENKSEQEFEIDFSKLNF